MNKRLFRVLLSVFAISIIFSCSKKSADSGEKPIDQVAFYTKKFMQDSTFASFFSYLIENSLVLGSSTNLQKKGMEDDSASAYNFATDIVTYQVMLRAENEGFFILSEQQQADILNNVCANLASDSYRNSHASTPLVVNATNIYNKLREFGPAAKLQSFDITWSEFAGCTAAALGTAFSEYGGVVGQVWRLISQGSQYLTWGSIWSIAKAVVKNAVPWYKVIGVAVGYGACLWSAI